MSISGRKIIGGLLAVSALTIIIAVVISVSGSGGFGDNIGLIYIEGVITSSTGASILPINRQTAISQLRAAESDPNIKALVIRIDSPGGSSGTSQELYQAVLRIRNKGIPVIISMGDTAASGGYYIASAADYIFANGSTITGSIGVIMEFINLEELYNKIGIEYEIIKSGQFKDAGNPSRHLTATEEELFQELIFDVWDQFVTDVANGRGLERARVEAIADGRILTGRQGVEVGLIDELGGLDDAIDKAIEIADVSGPVNIKTYQEPTTWLQRFLSVLGSVPQLLTNLPQNIISLKYQY